MEGFDDPMKKTANLLQFCKTTPVTVEKRFQKDITV